MFKGLDCAKNGNVWIRYILNNVTSQMQFGMQQVLFVRLAVMIQMRANRILWKQNKIHIFQLIHNIYRFASFFGMR